VRFLTFPLQTSDGSFFNLPPSPHAQRIEAVCITATGDGIGTAEIQLAARNAENQLAAIAVAAPFASLRYVWMFAPNLESSLETVLSDDVTSRPLPSEMWVMPGDSFQVQCGHGAAVQVLSCLVRVLTE